MRIALLVAAGFAAISSPALSQGLPSHSIFIACKLDPGSNAPVHYSPIGKATIPWLPKGSSEPNTPIIISGAFRDVMVDRGIKYYKAECYSGATVKQVRAWLDKAANHGEARLEIDAKSFWSPLVTWMVGLHSLHRTTADQYMFEPVESVSPNMKRSSLL